MFRDIIKNRRFIGDFIGDFRDFLERFENQKNSQH